MKKIESRKINKCRKPMSRSYQRNDFGVKCKVLYIFENNAKDTYLQQCDGRFVALRS